MKVSEQINLGMPILCDKCNQDLFLCQCPQEPFSISRLPEQNERQLLSDQIELLKARNESLERLASDFQHLILWNFYDMRSDEWRIQRNALLRRVEELIGS